MNEMISGKDEFIDKMKMYISEFGKSPGQKVFCDWANIKSNSYIGKFFSSHGELIRAAGGDANEWNKALPDEIFFDNFARCCLYVKRLATKNDMGVVRNEIGVTAWSGSYQKKFGNRQEFLSKFRDWIEGCDNENYKTILNYDGWDGHRGSKFSDNYSNEAIRSAGLDKISDENIFYLPTGLSDLAVMARNSNDSHPLLFERRCADAFKSLGFEVVDLGQGKGRVPDALALARKERYAVIIDAKAYAGGFSFNANEERKLKEYSEKYTAEVERIHGINRTYICVVSSGFKPSDFEKFKKSMTTIPVKGVSLWSAVNLMVAVSESIRDRYFFNLSDIEYKFNNSLNL